MKKINTSGGLFSPRLKSARSHPHPLILLPAPVFILIVSLIILTGRILLHIKSHQIDDLPAYHLTHYLAPYLANDPNSTPPPVILLGRIIEPPEYFSKRVRLQLEVQKIILPRQNIMTHGIVQLSWQNPKTRCQFYDTVQATVNLRLPQDYKNPGGFSYSSYLAQRGIFAIGSIRTLSLYKEAKIIPWSKLILRTLYRFRTLASEQIEHSLPKTEASLLQAMLLGERHKVSGRIMELFSEAGTIHLVSISGFHLTALALALFFTLSGILRTLPSCLLEPLSCLIRPSRLAALLSIVLIVFYTIMTGGRTPTIRAAIMVSAYFLALLVERKKSFYRPLWLAALAILLWQPEALFRLDFQLTFLASAGIIFTFDYLSAYRSYPASLRYPASLGSHLSRILKHLAEYLFFSFTLSLVAFIMTSPLTAYAFNLISPIGILTNLAAIPLASGTLYAGFAGLILLPLWPALSRYLLRLAAFLTRLILSLSTTAASCTRGFCYLPSPPKMAIAAIYSGLILLAILLHLLRGKMASVRKRACLLIFLLLLAAFLIPLILLRLVGNKPLAPAAPAHKLLTATFLDVGRGDACVIKTAGGKYILIDGGGSYNHYEFDFGRRVVAPYLWHERAAHLDLVILSHPHPDHLNGLLFILKHFSVGQVWKTKERSNNREYSLFEEIIQRKKIPVRIMTEGEEVELDGVLFQILAAGNLPDLPKNIKNTKIAFREENNRSLVLKLCWRQVSFLFTGDIEARAEKHLLPLGDRLRSTLIKVPHHGSRSSSSLPFLHLVAPQVAIFSGRRYGRQQFPHPKIVDRYQKLGCLIYRTDRDGAITVETDGVECRFLTYAKVFENMAGYPSWLKISSDYSDYSQQSPTSD